MILRNAFDPLNLADQEQDTMKASATIALVKFKRSNQNFFLIDKNITRFNLNSATPFTLRLSL